MSWLRPKCAELRECANIVSKSVLKTQRQIFFNEKVYTHEDHLLLQFSFLLLIFQEPSYSASYALFVHSAVGGNTSQIKISSKHLTSRQNWWRILSVTTHPAFPFCVNFLSFTNHILMHSLPYRTTRLLINGLTKQLHKYPRPPYSGTLILCL